MLRRFQWSARIIPALALALVLAVGGNREVRASQMYGLASHNSGFNPPADINGFYAYVTGSTSYSSGTNTTTVDFLVSAAFSTESIDEFAFNSNVTNIPESAFKVYSGTTTADPTANFNLKTTQNVSDAGSFTFDLGGPLNSNTTQSILVEFTVSGNHPLSDFVISNTTTPGANDFAVHLKTPSNGTGFVYGGTPTGSTITATPSPEPSTLVGGCMAGLIGLGYAFRRRKANAA